MGFLKKLLGGKDKEEPARGPSSAPVRPKKSAPAPAKVPPKTPSQPAQPTGVHGPVTPVGEMDAKALVRALGTSNKETREQAAVRLKALGDRQAIRPLMNAYMNYGDPAVLDALGSFGTDLTGPASKEAFDLSVLGERRARLMDVLGATGDETAIDVVRDFVDDSDQAIHIHASAALARLGDMGGVDRLASGLQQATDQPLRTMSMAALHDLGDIPSARAAIASHVERYLAEGGAIPKTIDVIAPRLAVPELPMTAFIVGEIKATPRDMVLVIGSGAGDMARSRQAELRRDLAGHNLFLLTPELAPEEQMNLLEEARDVASTTPEHTVLVIGVVPAPNDSPPLRHFLTTGQGGNKYSVKIIIVDPHEYMLLMDWWHYVEDRSEVDTEFAVVLSASDPAHSAISAEEHLIYHVATDVQKQAFPRALLAHF